MSLVVAAMGGILPPLLSLVATAMGCILACFLYNYVFPITRVEPVIFMISPFSCLSALRSSSELYHIEVGTQEGFFVHLSFSYFLPPFVSCLLFSAWVYVFLTWAFSLLVLLGFLVLLGILQFLSEFSTR